MEIYSSYFHPFKPINPSKPHQPPLGDRKLRMLLSSLCDCLNIPLYFLFSFFLKSPPSTSPVFKMAASAPKESILKMRPRLHFSETKLRACGKAACGKANFEPVERPGLWKSEFGLLPAERPGLWKGEVPNFLTSASRLKEVYEVPEVFSIG